MLSIFFFPLLILITVVQVLLLVQNSRVYNYRQRLLRQISKCAQNDILQKRDWEWRYKVLDSVSYDRMMYRPWRRLESWWPDRSFLLPEGFPDAKSSTRH